jgi:hypothetical protein
MQYAQIIQFDPLETVIELKQANQLEKARHLVASYMISQAMAERLIHLVPAQLRFDQTRDNKGLLIIGNYGTGKSHLMAVISSLAENAELISELTHPSVAKALQVITGQFKVLRIEIGATTMSLRDIVTTELTEFFQQSGIDFQFPTVDTITNNKQTFIEMMAAFTAKFPQQGLLLAVDELLEYLRARKDQELILDLNFLREIGEACKELRLRFIAGLQESIFDNQRFEFVAHSVRRVKDRFEQILITRKDIKFVVAQRLLKKNPQQCEQIKTYLSRFAPCYGVMNERLTEFCELFPVHPDYIETFERITVIEKREVLKTLAQGVQKLMAQTIPKNQPGLLAYDSYWQTIQENPSFRAIPEIREVIECSQVLENRLTQAFTRPAYLTLALRIVHALSVHRLTTHDIYAPVGVTASELRDSLCLYQPGIEELGGNPAEDLLSLIESILREILKTVNRQFISTNPDNGQYYLDFKKNYDYDAIIEKREESLENHQLDRYYYVALRQVMEISDIPALWQQSFTWRYEFEWRSHRVTRQGYLIFGAPNRTTHTLVQPTDNFLLYFLPLNQNESVSQSSFSATESEVLFQITKIDEPFEHSLRFYAAATDLATTAAGHAKSIYESKAQTYLREVVQWLQEHKATAFAVTYQQKTRLLLDWLGDMKHEALPMKTEPALFKPHPTLLENFRDLIDLIADICLDHYFLQQAPEYPVFPILVSQENLLSIAQETLRGITHSSRSKQARGMLTSLALLDGEEINPTGSKYAQALLALLRQKPVEQVVNRDEIFATVAGDAIFFAPYRYRLEPELVMILIVALVASGEVLLVTNQQVFDTHNVTELANIPLKELLHFKHLERPKSFHLPSLKALFELFALPTDLATALIDNDPNAVAQLQTQISVTLSKLIQTQQLLASGFLFWGQPLFKDAQRQSYQDQLTQTKTFLESLQAYSSPLKFKNFHYDIAFIKTQQAHLSLLQELLHLQNLLTESSQPVAYLTAAEAILPAHHPWLTDMNQVRDTLLSQLNDAQQRYQTGFNYTLQQQLQALQKSYLQAYLTLHQQARLSETEHQIKQELLHDQRLLNLKKLARFTLLPHQQLRELETRLNQLHSCYALTERDLMRHAFCRHCSYKPYAEIANLPAVDYLSSLEQGLTKIHYEWTQMILKALEQTDIQTELLKPTTQTQLENFLTQRELPNEITVEFLEAIQEGLAKLIKVVINMEALQEALSSGGTPTTVVEIQKRFINHLNGLTQGKELSRVRILLE